MSEAQIEEIVGQIADAETAYRTARELAIVSALSAEDMQIIERHWQTIHPLFTALDRLTGLVAAQGDLTRSVRDLTSLLAAREGEVAALREARRGAIRALAPLRNRIKREHTSWLGHNREGSWIEALVTAALSALAAKEGSDGQ